jgi:hypothetical protein
MGVLKIRNNADDGWIELGGIGTVYQSDSAPANPHAGQMWLDTDDSLPEDIGAMVLIESQEASGDAFLEFTDLGGYSKLHIIIEHMLPSTGGPAFGATVSDDNGVSYISSGYYAASLSSGHTGTYQDTGGVTTSWWLHYPTGVGSDAGDAGLSVDFKLMGFNEVKKTNGCGNHTFWSSSNIMEQGTFGVMLNSTEILNALKFEFQSGNIASGRITIYGIKD